MPGGEVADDDALGLIFQRQGESHEVRFVGVRSDCVAQFD